MNLRKRRLTKTLGAIVVVCFAILCAGAAFFVLNSPPAKLVSARSEPPSPRQPAPSINEALPVATSNSDRNPRQNEVAVDTAHGAKPRTETLRNAGSKTGTVPATRNAPHAADPLARQALQLVGADPEAEFYWVSAINDPTLPQDERRNLIEDLNEDGLSDPKHPRAEDFLLIIRRLELLDELAQFPMDRVNSEAFAEAHKDLVNLLAGEPVP